jgi:signal transduction histidine kinase
MGTPPGPSSPGKKASPTPPVNVIATIKNVMADLEHLADQRGVDVELARSFEEAQVGGTPQALAEILQNLVWNAMEASQPGGLVRVSIHQRGDNVVIDISDDGSGIPREHLSKVFQPGYTTKKGSAGMGLNIVERRLGEMLGSIVWVSPISNGRGTRFTVTLPTLPSSVKQM